MFESLGKEIGDEVTLAESEIESIYMYIVMYIIYVNMHSPRLTRRVVATRTGTARKYNRTDFWRAFIFLALSDEARYYFIPICYFFLAKLSV